MTIATSLYIDPLSGGYVAVNSSLVKINSTVNKANLLLAQRIGSNIYYMNEGNPLLSETSLIPASDIAAGINVCLAPLLNNGDISLLQILKITLSLTYRYTVSIAIHLPDGTTEQINWRR